MAMLDRREVEGVVVAKLDRLTRSVVDMATLVSDYFGERAGYVRSRPIDHRNFLDRVKRRLV